MGNNEELVGVVHEKISRKEIDSFISQNPDFCVECGSKIRELCFKFQNFQLVRGVELLPTNKRFHTGYDVPKFLPSFEIEKYGKIYFRNPNLFDCCGRKIILGREKKINAALYKLKKKMKFKEIFSIFRKCDSYREFNCFDIAEIASRLINEKEGELWERGKGIYIFPEEGCEGEPFWFQIYVDNDGKISITESRFYLTGDLEEGSGVVFV